MSWLQKYRMLVIAYGLALVVGGREYFVSRTADTSSWMGGCEASAAACSLTPRASAAADSAFWIQHAELARVVVAVNPDDPDTHFLRSMQALADGDQEESIRQLENALSSGVKHNDYLLRLYAQYELSRGADWQRVNFAINRWRRNHPFSADPLYLQLGVGPESEAEERLLHELLASVPWIGGSEVERTETADGVRWRVGLTFRPGRIVDIRQAVEAVTTLSVPQDQRARLRVRCSTLVDCQVEPRSGR